MTKQDWQQSAERFEQLAHNREWLYPSHAIGAQRASARIAILCRLMAEQARTKAMRGRGR